MCLKGFMWNDGGWIRRKFVRLWWNKLGYNVKIDGCLSDVWGMWHCWHPWNCDRVSTLGSRTGLDGMILVGAKGGGLRLQLSILAACVYAFRMGLPYWRVSIP